jgi:hypothetical protein
MVLYIHSFENAVSVSNKLVGSVLKYKPNEYYKNEMKPKTTSETAPKSTSLS